MVLASNDKKDLAKILRNEGRAVASCSEVIGKEHLISVIFHPTHNVSVHSGIGRPSTSALILMAKKRE
jgi:hypothetical protein